MSDIEAVRSVIRKERRIISLFVANGLNQTVTVQVEVNRVNAMSGIVNMGAAFTVAAGGTDSRTLSPETSGWLPFITVEVSCSVAPGSGVLDIYKDDGVVGGVVAESKLVTALAIRDVVAHNPTTDPAAVFLREW